MKSDKETISFLVIRIVAIGLLLWAYAKHPIGYYTLLRFVVFATCAYGAYYAWKLERTGWIWAMAPVAVLFNPIFPIYFYRGAWQVIDTIVAAFLLLSIPLLRLSPKNTEESDQMTLSTKKRIAKEIIIFFSAILLLALTYGLLESHDWYLRGKRRKLAESVRQESARVKELKKGWPQNATDIKPERLRNSEITQLLEAFRDDIQDFISRRKPSLQKRLSNAEFFGIVPKSAPVPDKFSDENIAKMAGLAPKSVPTISELQTFIYHLLGSMNRYEYYKFFSAKKNIGTYDQFSQMVNQALGIDHAAFELIRKAEAEIQLKNVSSNVILSRLLSRTEKLEIIKYTAFFLFLVVYIIRAIIFILIWSVKTLRAP